MFFLLEVMNLFRFFFFLNKHWNTFFQFGFHLLFYSLKTSWNDFFIARWKKNLFSLHQWHILTWEANIWVHHQTWGNISNRKNRYTASLKCQIWRTFFFTPYKFHIWKQESSFLSLGTNTGRKQRGISSGHRRWICFIQESKPWLYTKWDWVCPDMLCVCVPLFITSNTFSALCQYCASSLMQLNSVTATGALSPGATVSDLQSRCILSHLGAHH